MPYRVLFLRRREQSFCKRTNPTREHSDQVFREKCHSRRSDILLDRSVRYFFAASASLSAPGTGLRAASVSSRGKSGVHCEVAAQFDSGDSRQCPPKEATYRRSRRRGFAHLSAKEAPWLNPPLSAVFVSSWPAATTATLRKSWRRFTACWCLAQGMSTT